MAVTGGRFCLSLSLYLCLHYVSAAQPNVEQPEQSEPLPPIRNCGRSQLGLLLAVPNARDSCLLHYYTSASQAPALT